MKTRIVVDSTADILPEYLDQIHTVPLTVSFGEENTLMVLLLIIAHFIKN